MTRKKQLLAIIIFTLFACIEADAAQVGIGKGNIYSVPTLTTLYQNSTITGTLTETNLATIPIRGGLIGKHGILQVRMLWQYNTSANPRTVRIYYGGVLIGSNSLSGGLGTVTWNYITQAKNSYTDHLVYNLVFGSSVTATTITIDNRNDNNLVMSCQLTNVSDICTLAGYFVELIK